MLQKWGIKIYFFILFFLTQQQEDSRSVPHKDKNEKDCLVWIPFLAREYEQVTSSLIPPVQNGLFLNNNAPIILHIVKIIIKSSSFCYIRVALFNASETNTIRSRQIFLSAAPHLEGEKKTLTFYVNGKKEVVHHVEPDLTLIDHLRTSMQLTGRVCLFYFSKKYFTQYILL